MRIVRKHTSALFALGIAATAVAILPASPAGAAGKTVQVGNNTAVTVAKGWTSNKGQHGQVELTRKSPHAVIEIAAFAGVSGTVESNAATNFTQFAQGFGLKHVKVTGRHSAQIPGEERFDSAASITYTGTYQGQKLGGLAIEYQLSTNGDGAFAVAIAKQSDKPKLQNSVSQILQSIASNA